MQHRRRWILVLLFMSALTAPSFTSPVAAFKVINHEMYKDPDYKQSTNRFSPTDEAAYWLIDGTLEASDVRAELGLKIYRPCSGLFAGGRLGITVVSSGALRVVLVISITKFGFLGGVHSPVYPVGATLAYGSIFISPAAVKTWPFTLKSTQDTQAPSGRPGEWRIELTLDDKPVATERFWIGAETTDCVEFPINLLLVAIVVVIVALVGVYVYMRRKKPPSIVEPVRGSKAFASNSHLVTRVGRVAIAMGGAS